MSDKDLINLLKKAYKNLGDTIPSFLREEYAKYVMERAYRKRFIRWILIFLVLIPSLIFIMRMLAKFLQGA